MRLFFVFLLTYLSAASISYANSETPYLDSIGKVNILADEKSMPFKRQGYSLKEANIKGHTATVKQYTKPIKKFFDVRNCLKDSQKTQAQPDLKEFAWKKMQSTYEADVCMFRVASSYNDIETFKLWLKAQGLRTLGPQKFKHIKKEVIVLEAARDHRKQKRLFTSHFLQNLLSFDYSYSVSIWYDENGELYTLNSVFNTL